ncbi:MAG: hypothetical protein ABEJ34_02075 [Haloferacaceae archaeon]
MTPTETDLPTPSDESPTVSPGLAEGRSRLLLFAGLVGFAVGHLVDAPPVVWGGIALVAVAFAVNTAGKLTHYRRLSIPRGDRTKLAASWVLLAVTVVWLLAVYARARYGPGGGRFFWSLAAAGLGFGLLHMAAQSKYLPADAAPDER